MSSNNLTPIILLVETVLLLLLWLNNPYLASLISAIIVPICFGIWIVSIISEKIEKSKVSSSFFKTVLFMGVVPIVLAIFFYWVNGEIIWE